MKRVLFCLMVVSLKVSAQHVYEVTPLDNLSTVLASLIPGDTVKFSSGIYFGPVDINNLSGDMDNPIVFIGPDDISNSAVIDSRMPSPNPARAYKWLEITNSSWLEFINLHFQNAWLDPVEISNSSYISVKNCYFQGGRRIINVRGEASHHVLVENCFWDQGATYAWNVRQWTDGDAWESMHHGSLSFLNGSLFTSQGSSGSHILRGNTIQNAFNAFRWRGDVGFDANIEINENTILRIRDNDFEPEDYAKNLFIHHNWTHNIHKTLSIDHVNGGDIYYFGNVITNDDDSWSEDICTGYYKVYGAENDNLSDPLYIFNNSYYGSGRLHGSIGSRLMQHVNHFNNAFYLTKRKWELDQWNETLIYDYDCSNKSFSGVLTNNGQEANGLVADPLYNNPEAYDLTLQEGSPCIDAGLVLEIEGLDWKSTYRGSAPDIGAFDQNLPVVGPFFRTDTLALDNPIQENPRITQLRVQNDSTFLSFSYPINEATVASSITIRGEDGEEAIISSFNLYDNGYTLGFLAGFSVTKAWINGSLLGKNGLPATNWGNATDFEKVNHDNVVTYMLHPQLQPRVPPPPNSGVYLEGDLERSIVPRGTQLTINALADEGFKFDGWEGDINANDTTATLTLNESAWIVAHFSRVEQEPFEEDPLEELPLGLEESGIQVYPNPSLGVIFLKGKFNASTARLVDLSGKATVFPVQENQLDVRNLKAGVYLLEILHEGKVVTKRIYLEND